MKTFKVTFENNKAVSVIPIDSSYSIDLNIDNPEGKLILKWFIIMANDEQEGIKVANKIAHNIMISTHA